MPTPEALAARFGTPLYVYDEARLQANARALATSLGARLGAAVHYALKANSNPWLVRTLRAEGLKADAVSEGEVHLALAAGFAPHEISCTPNNASLDELLRIHALGVDLVIDSLDSLAAFGRARHGARVGLRINPGVGGGHHPHVVTAGPASKFGLVEAEWSEARAIAARTGILIHGLQQHIGSGILEPAPMQKAVELLLTAAERFEGLQVIDFGGGFGIPYRDTEQPLDLEALAASLAPLLAAERARRGPHLEFRFEPGRAAVATAGTLLVRVTAVKLRDDRLIAGVDSGFSHLIRPMLYDAHHRIRNLTRPDAPLRPTDVAGNICESGDLFARRRPLPEAMVGDLLAIDDVGAYGFSMASPYNLRGRPAEVLVQASGAAALIRQRETLPDLLALVPDRLAP